MPGVSMGIHSVAALGEHNEEILREIAGLSGEEIAALADDGIISNLPLPTESRP
jgi:crotonobetainyl-CoA:carnitine CoA-transferase CaiB-like acyl-CoA transferase